MRFRPCIDIHNGQVKQLVGGSLTDAGNRAEENFVAEQSAGYYAEMYRRDGLSGGHIILLNPVGSGYYEADLRQAREALRAFPGGMQIGGGVRAETAADFLDMGASHVIVTSYVFSDGQIKYENLERLVREVGREHIVLDLSCRKAVAAPDSGEQPESRSVSRGSELLEISEAREYRIVTDRWQKFTDVSVTEATLRELSAYCDEFLIHAVDVEGKCSGIEQELAAMLGRFDLCPVTYAGGVAELSDIRLLHELGQGRLDVTVGSALDLFGGKLPYRSVIQTVRDF